MNDLLVIERRMEVLRRSLLYSLYGMVCLCCPLVAAALGLGPLQKRPNTLWYAGGVPYQRTFQSKSTEIMQKAESRASRETFTVKESKLLAKLASL